MTLVEELREGGQGPVFAKQGDLLKRAAKEIERLDGEVRSRERDYVALQVRHDARVTELLAANNAEVERRRAAEAALAGPRMTVSAAQLLAERLAELESEIAALKAEDALVLQELAATGHQHSGEPLHILVDKAIDRERDRIEAARAGKPDPYYPTRDLDRAMRTRPDAALVEATACMKTILEPWNGWGAEEDWAAGRAQALLDLIRREIRTMMVQS